MRQTFLAIYIIFAVFTSTKTQPFPRHSVNDDECVKQRLIELGASQNEIDKASCTEHKSCEDLCKNDNSSNIMKECCSDECNGCDKNFINFETKQSFNDDQCVTQRLIELGASQNEIDKASCTEHKPCEDLCTKEIAVQILKECCPEECKGCEEQMFILFN